MEMNGKSQDIHIAMQMQTVIQFCVAPIRKVKIKNYILEFLEFYVRTLIIFLTRR